MTSYDLSSEQLVFGTSIPSEVEAALRHWCRRNLGSPVRRIRFTAGQLTYVVGLDLEDRRDVVVRAQAETGSLERMLAVYEAQ